MRVKVLGYREVNMVDDKTGRPIVGVTLFISYPMDGVFGEMATKQYISDQLRSACGFRPEVGKVVNLEYGPNGRPVGVYPLDEK